MPIVWIVFAVLIIALLLGATKSRGDGINFKERWPLEAKQQVLSERERVLFHRLQQALPGHVVLAQVQLIQILKFPRGKRTHALFNRICRLSLDFVILRPDTSIVAAVELDDVTHERADRQAADARKTHALQSAGIQLVRWNAKAIPDLQTIKGTIAPDLPAIRI
jgi:very-short-patch-repair endonuclease